MHDGESGLCQSFVEHEYNHLDAMDNAPVKARELAASFAARILVLSYSLDMDSERLGSEGGRQGDAPGWPSERVKTQQIIWLKV
jgi:hypothetical protein